MSRQLFINGRFLTQPITGVQRYAHETLLALDALLAEDRSLLPEGCAVSVVAPMAARRPALRAIAFQQQGPLSGNGWEQLTLPWITRKGFLLSFGPTGPLLKARQVVTMHDAAVYAVPESFSRPFRAWYRLLLPILARRSPALMTVSNFSKGELARTVGAAPERTHVTGGGWEHALKVAADSTILSRHGLSPHRYVLAVGSVTPHKNLGVLAEAIGLLGAADFHVAVAGSVNSRVFSGITPTSLNALKLLGYVSDAELRALYENAAAYVFPSLYEGFGIPPLEALALGCPVIASNAAAIPEVCGESAWYFAPDDAQGLAKLMQEVVEASAAVHAQSPESSARHDALAIAREQTLQRYNWRAVAATHLGIIARLLSVS